MDTYCSNRMVLNSSLIHRTDPQYHTSHRHVLLKEVLRAKNQSDQVGAETVTLFTLDLDEVQICVGRKCHVIH